MTSVAEAGRWPWCWMRLALLELSAGHGVPEHHSSNYPPSHLPLTYFRSNHITPETWEPLCRINGSCLSSMGRMASVRALLLALLSVHALDVAIADKKFGKLVRRDAPLSECRLSLDGLTFEKQTNCGLLYLSVTNLVNHNGGLTCRVWCSVFMQMTVATVYKCIQLVG